MPISSPHGMADRHVFAVLADALAMGAVFDLEYNLVENGRHGRNDASIAYPPPEFFSTLDELLGQFMPALPLANQESSCLDAKEQLPGSHRPMLQDTPSLQVIKSSVAPLSVGLMFPWRWAISICSVQMLIFGDRIPMCRGS